jgi:purine nucleosidase
MARHYVLYDTDPGVDDAMALLFLRWHPDIVLLGVTSVFGNASIDTTTANALYLCGRFAPGVPVARGAGAPLRRSAPAPVDFIHGRDGLGDVLPAGAARSANAVLAGRSAHAHIVETIRSRPGEVTLLAVGPLTNLALALAEAPDIAGLVRQVVIMGGAFGVSGVLGNVTPAAEANIAADPDAADQVLGAAWPVTIVGLDVTQRTIMPTRYLEALAGVAGETGRFIWDITRLYSTFHLDSAQVDGIYVHDSSAAAYIVAPHLYRTRLGAVRVLTEGIAAGQTIQKPVSMRVSAPAWDGRAAQQACVDVDAAGFLELYWRTLARAG